MPRATGVPAPVLVLGAIASVQSGAAIATRLFPDVGPSGTVLLRLVLSAPMLLLVARPRLRKRSRRDLAYGIAYGVALGAMNGTFYEALDRIPLGVAVTLEMVGPLTVAIRSSRRGRDVVWVALAAIGVVLLTTGGGHLDGPGVVLALVAGAFWGAYILLAQRVGAVFPGASGLALGLTVAAAVVAPFGLVHAGTKLTRPSVLGRGAAVALLSSAVPYSLELFALRRLRAAVFGILMALEPAMATLSGWAFLGQHLHGSEWIALVCVVVASIGATTARHPDGVVTIDAGATPLASVDR